MDDYRPGAAIRLGDDADNVRYDATKKHCMSDSDGRPGGNQSARGKVLGEVKLAGHPESFQLERGPHARSSMCQRRVISRSSTAGR